jgi:hypothetical protein
MRQWNLVNRRVRFQLFKQLYKIQTIFYPPDSILPIFVFDFYAVFIEIFCPSWVLVFPKHAMPMKKMSLNGLEIHRFYEISPQTDAWHLKILYVLWLILLLCLYHICKKILYVYLTPVPILRLRKYGIARPCIYFDVSSLALYKHSVKTRWMLALYYRCIKNDSYCTLNGLNFWYVINRILKEYVQI